MKTFMRTRNDFSALLKELGLTGNACEVGVAEGYNSFNILDNWAGRLYMVDPWALLKTQGFSGHGEDTSEGMEKRYQRILESAKRYNKPRKHPRCIPMRMTSEEAVTEFDDGFFDFVYLDANHSLPSVQEDIALWWPKVKRSGILAGHDHLQGIVDGVDYGVKQAVDEFSTAYGLTANVTQETEYPSWWIVKP